MNSCTSSTVQRNICQTAHGFIHIPSELKTTCSTKLIMDFRIIVYLRKLCIFYRCKFGLLTSSNKSACKWWKETINSNFPNEIEILFLGKSYKVRHIGTILRLMVGLTFTDSAFNPSFLHNFIFVQSVACKSEHRKRNIFKT